MNNNTRKIVIIILCIILSLSLVFVGKALFRMSETEQTPEKQDEETSKNTWSIYIYMVGSNLEDAELNQLSKLTETLVEADAKHEQEAYDNMVAERIRNLAKEVSDMGMTLPNALYNKSYEDADEKEPASSEDLGYGTYNINTMLESELPDGVQIIIQTGGAKRWLSPYVNPNRSQRFVIDKNGITLVYDETIVNMADPDTLEDFMVFCKEKYPAENEMIIFWDHGSSYSGFGMDNIYGTDMLTVREMVSCFENVSKLYSNENNLFDIIGFDACLMGNLETARLFSDYADYYLSSPEILPGLGWGYGRILEALNENPQISSKDLGEVICKANVENAQIYIVDGLYPTTFSMVDLKAIEKVYDAYSVFAKKLLIDSIEDINNLTKVSEEASNTLAYAYGNNGGYNLIDLGVFAKNVSKYYPQEAKAITDSLNECVLYQESCSYFNESTGLSVYYPSRMVGVVSLRKYLSYMYDLSDNPDIDALYYYKVVGYLNEPLRNYVSEQGYGEVKAIDFVQLKNISYEAPKLDGKGNFSLTLDKDYLSLIQEVKFGLIYLDASTSDVVHFGEFQKKQIKEDGTADTDFDLTMPSLEGSELPAVQIGENDENITYRVPISYYGTSAYMIFTQDKETKEYTIQGFNMSNDNGTGIADRTVMEFEEGDSFQVIYTYSNLNTSEQTEAIVRFTYSKDMKIVDKVISDGYYLEYLEFDDLRSDVYYTPIVVIEVRDGEIVQQYIDWGINASDYSKRQ